MSKIRGLWRPILANDPPGAAPIPKFPELAGKIERMLSWLATMPSGARIAETELWKKADVEIGLRRVRFRLDLQRRLISEYDRLLQQDGERFFVLKSC